MYPGVELRLLRYVVAVAEELHFSRAAERLHVAQPSLSKQIRDLEDEIGIRLFDRTKRDVHLTQAGQAFVIHAKEALVHSQRAVHAAKATQQPDRFTLGHSPDINPRLLLSVRAIPAQLWKLTFRSVFTMEQLQLIRAGELDAGVVILPVPDESLTIEPILVEPLVAALPEQHELCGKKALRLRDLRDVPLITIPKSLHPFFYDRMYSICVQEGFTPTIAQEATSFPEAMSLVADGVGVAFTRECYERFKCPGVVFRKIEGQPLAVESAIAFRKGERSSVLPAIIAALQVKKNPAPVLAFQSRAPG
jgi:DNA-binding transcriptional LysR family regulator